MSIQKMSRYKILDLKFWKLNTKIKLMIHKNTSQILFFRNIYIPYSILHHWFQTHSLRSYIAIDRSLINNQEGFLLLSFFFWETRGDLMCYDFANLITLWGEVESHLSSKLQCNHMPTKKKKCLNCSSLIFFISKFDLNLNSHRQNKKPG